MSESSTDWRHLPPDITSCLLDPSWTVKNLLLIQMFPPVDSAISTHASIAFQLSKVPPIETSTKLLSRPIPPKETLQAMQRELSSVAAEYACSFIDTLLNGKPTSLWMVEYWLWVLHALEAQTKWASAHAWLSAELDSVSMGGPILVCGHNCVMYHGHASLESATQAWTWQLDA